MRKYLLLFLSLLFISVSIIKTPTIALANDNKVYLGGMPAGFSLNTRGAFIMGITDVISENGINSPAKDALLKTGDVILKIDGIEVNNSNDVEKAITDNKVKNLLVLRNDQEQNVLIKPTKDINGKFKLGVFIRDNVKGIGTITFIKNNRFASLGHPISEEDGKISNAKDGELYDCFITGNVKGERGKAGELKGIFTKTMPIGEIDTNCSQGVYGKITPNFNLNELEQVEISNAKIGEASIYSTIIGNKPKEYKISIIKADNDLEGNKNLVLKITDKELIEQTGGIIQGMSGSPILQNGKLVGAVTHVFINDPERGFGISIENMINK